MAKLIETVVVKDGGLERAIKVMIATEPFASPPRYSWLKYPRTWEPAEDATGGSSFNRKLRRRTGSASSWH
jgi:hypothetical protein